MACPLCRSRNRAIATVSSCDGYSNLVIRGIGAINLTVCMDCGTVYLDQQQRDRYKKYKESQNA